AAKSVRVAELNVQNQQKIEWPKNKSVALAYIDQLERSGGLAADDIASLRQLVESSRLGQAEVAKLKNMLQKSAGQAKSRTDSARLQALAEVLSQPGL